ncbi:unnamed protein product, partial [Pocillopora meandrina]
MLMAPTFLPHSLQTFSRGLGSTLLPQPLKVCSRSIYGLP